MKIIKVEINIPITENKDSLYKKGHREIEYDVVHDTTKLYVLSDEDATRIGKGFNYSNLPVLGYPEVDVMFNNVAFDSGIFGHIYTTKPKQATEKLIDAMKRKIEQYSAFANINIENYIK